MHPVMTMSDMPRRAMPHVARGANATDHRAGITVLAIASALLRWLA
jgi:hypothetical protein